MKKLLALQIMLASAILRRIPIFDYCDISCAIFNRNMDLSRSSLKYFPLNSPYFLTGPIQGNRIWRAMLYIFDLAMRLLSRQNYGLFRRDAPTFVFVLHREFKLKTFLALRVQKPHPSCVRHKII